MTAFASTGKYRVVAFDMRGYGMSSRPEPSWARRGDYAMEHLIADVKAVIETLGYQHCTLVSHDWGGMVAWAFAFAHRNMIEKLIVMNAPHPRAMRDNASLKQVFRSWYVLFFQLPFVPALLLRLNRFAFLSDAFFGKPMGIRRNEPLTLKPEEVDVYKWGFDQAGGVEAPLHYYRNVLTANAGFQAKIFSSRHGLFQPPTLLIWGENDAALGVELTRGMDKYCRDCSVKVIKNASHWVQQDAVTDVLTEMALFLGVDRITQPISLTIEKTSK